MKEILNGILKFFKWVLFIISFATTFYIILSMYDRLNKNIIEAIDIFIPFIILLILFFINLVAKQNSVSKNLFYNLTSVIVFLTILIVDVRTIFDKNMVLNEIMGYDINFSYFSDFLSFMKVLLYGLSIANIFFMFQVKKEKKINTNQIARKITASPINDSSVEVL